MFIYVVFSSSTTHKLSSLSGITELWSWFSIAEMKTCTTVAAFVLRGVRGDKEVSIHTYTNARTHKHH